MPHTYGTTGSKGQEAEDRLRLQQQEEERTASRPNHMYQGRRRTQAEGEAEEGEKEGRRNLPTTTLPVVSKIYYEEDEEGQYLQRRVRQAGMGVALIVSVCACLMLFGLKHPAGGGIGGGRGAGSLPSASPADVGSDDVLFKGGSHRPQELRQPEVR